jgi:hypothetical protein
VNKKMQKNFVEWLWGNGVFLRAIALVVGLPLLAASAPDPSVGTGFIVRLTHLDDEGKPRAAPVDIVCRHTPCQAQMQVVFGQEAEPLPVSVTFTIASYFKASTIRFGPARGCETVPPGVSWRDSMSTPVPAPGGTAIETKAIRLVRFVRDDSMVPPERCQSLNIRVRAEVTGLGPGAR